MSQQFPSPSAPVSTLPGAYELGGSDAYRYKQQLAAGDFAEFRAYLHESKLRKDWDDRSFILKLVCEKISWPALEAAEAAEPDAPDLALMRGALLAHLVRESRGSKVVESHFSRADAACRRTDAAGDSCLAAGSATRPHRPHTAPWRWTPSRSSLLPLAFLAPIKKRRGWRLVLWPRAGRW